MFHILFLFGLMQIVNHKVSIMMNFCLCTFVELLSIMQVLAWDWDPLFGIPKYYGHVHLMDADNNFSSFG